LDAELIKEILNEEAATSKKNPQVLNVESIDSEDNSDEDS